ncbi:uncharacterized protein NFIA_039970 [Aspergillus fischeri NRRL 181]|uniref:Zinc finger protein n=1 Tax=Neosartorya fischeri (strain ATCC 1020 / DSM 3700 / CBS 544.65 / FGSC A1164 / JCM 1740 / NRRL 181 / WB 181) TaxID=331117 RepID=A1D0A1_NEOFI|nr:conserved hypothetical protein [Aspergillus fischeri NRRL 181]EAW24421.1 conserved hypothetical protein [Aspergillus fischeri NRRL 181]
MVRLRRMPPRTRNPPAHQIHRNGIPTPTTPATRKISLDLNRYPQTFACKKCKKCFRKDATEFDESDEYCPHCDNHFVIDAVTPKAALQVEGDDARIDSRMIKDDRVREHKEKSIFNFKDISDRLG